MAKISFESTPCAKCGGAGNIRAFSGVYGGVCFSCGGAGKHLTRNGKRASAKLQAWRDATLRVSFEQIVPGMSLRVPRQFAGFGSGGEQWVTFRRPLVVVRVLAAVEGQDRAVVFRFSKSLGWLNVDVEKKELTLQFREGELYRVPTKAELEAVFPTLGKGAIYDAEEPDQVVDLGGTPAEAPAA